MMNQLDDPRLDSFRENDDTISFHLSMNSIEFVCIEKDLVNY